MKAPKQGPPALYELQWGTSSLYYDALGVAALTRERDDAVLTIWKVGDDLYDIFFERSGSYAAREGFNVDPLVAQCLIYAFADGTLGRSMGPEELEIS